MKELRFFDVKPGELYGAEYEDSTGDALWIVAGYDEFYKIRPNHYEDAIIVHWFEKETSTLHLYKTLGEETWLLHGYEDMEFGHFDSNYGDFWRMSIIDHLFKFANKITVGKIV